MALPQTGEISFRDFNTDRGLSATNQIDMDSAAIAYGIPSKPHGMDEFRGRAVGGATTTTTTIAPTTTTTTLAPVYYRIQFCDDFSSGNSFSYPAGTFSTNDRVSANSRTAIVTSSSTSNPGGTLLSLTSLGATGCPAPTTTTTTIAPTTTTTTTTTFGPISFNLSQLGCDGQYPTLRANNFTGGNNSWSYVKIGTSQANAANSSPIDIAFNESNYDFLGVYQLSNNVTYYVILADDGGRTAMRSVTPTGCSAPTTTTTTTTTTTDAPSGWNYSIGMASGDAGSACNSAQNGITNAVAYSNTYSELIGGRFYYNIDGTPFNQGGTFSDGVTYGTFNSLGRFAASGGCDSL